MYYIELDKETDDIVAGVLEGNVLPEVNEDNPYYFREVVSFPDIHIVYGQVFNKDTSSIEDTQTSINSKSLSYLLSTDWYEVRSISGIPTPADILTKRQEARDSIV